MIGAVIFAAHLIKIYTFTRTKRYGFARIAIRKIEGNTTLQSALF